MKFGKEFTAQMVPEWQEAYMDYIQLKSLLKEIQHFKQITKPPTTPDGLKRKLTLYRAFSGLTQRNNHHTGPSSVSNDIESHAIFVNSVNNGGSQSYQTTFLMSSDEGGEYELVYFRRLDDELNKVNKFYKAKVDEVMKEAAMLNKQMDALIAFRIKVEKPEGGFDRSGEMTRLASDVAASTAALAASTPKRARSSVSKFLKLFHMVVVCLGKSNWLLVFVFIYLFIFCLWLNLKNHNCIFENKLTFIFVISYLISKLLKIMAY